MAALREQDLADYLKKKSAAQNGLLLYGNDAAAVSTALRQVVSAFSGGEEALRLDVSALRSDPALLDDAFRSMSLLGDRRLIVVDGVGEQQLGLVQPVLAATGLGNFVVIVADSLKRDSKLKAAVDAAPLFSSVSFYEETGGALVQRAENILRQHGMAFEDGAAERFVDLCGGDRTVVMAEAEKLSLYCWPSKSISVADVEAACGDQAEFEADALIQTMLDGEIETADRIFSSMRDTGDSKSILIMVQMHLARLEQVSAAVARGIDMSSACRAARPPFFDKQQAAAGRHIRIFSGDELGRVQVSVQQAILQSRQMADLADAVTGRCVLSVARLARQLRARANG
jgi:DNA polymerase III subunit delta